jgi:hypothetical protein
MPRVMHSSPIVRTTVRITDPSVVRVRSEYTLW